MVKSKTLICDVRLGVDDDFLTGGNTCGVLVSGLPVMVLSLGADALVMSTALVTLLSAFVISFLFSSTGIFCSTTVLFEIFVVLLT